MAPSAMISCTACGTDNPDSGVFCWRCNSYLPWTGERSAPADAAEAGVATSSPSPPPVHPRHHAPRTLVAIEHVASRVGHFLGDQLHYEHAIPTTVVEPEPEPPDATASVKGVALVLHEPSPVLPAEPEHHHHPAIETDGSSAASGQPCPRCGYRNDAERHFCSWCGATLLHPAPVPHVSWWRRMARTLVVHRRRRRDARLRHLIGEHELPAASSTSGPTAPRRWRRRRRAGSVPLPAALGAGSGHAAATSARVPPRRRAPLRTTVPDPMAAISARLARAERPPVLGSLTLVVAAVSTIGALAIFHESIADVTRQAFATVSRRVDVLYREVDVRSVSAATSVDGRVPALAGDGTLATYWAAPSAADAAITFSFAEQMPISQIGISPGVQNGDVPFKSAPRPKSIELSFADGSTRRLELRDDETFRRYSFSAARTTSVTITVLDVYEPLNQQATWLAITDIVFFVRR